MVTEKYIHVGEHELLYLGRINDLAVHSHLTWTLCFALDTNFQYSSSVESLTTKQPILIPPNLKHKIEAKGSFMVFIFLKSTLLMLIAIGIKKMLFCKTGMC